MTTINKDNYEEYFLLFADNELSKKEKSMVEDFVKQHADLEEEFLSIRQSVLQPDDEVMLGDKSSLLRHSKKQIAHSNYEDFFILYVDNELTVFEKAETELFLSQNPSSKTQFELFQKTKLSPDNTIIFPDKHLLLKREYKVRTIPFAWWKAGAAAVLTALGLWITAGLLKENKREIPVTVKSNNGKKPASTTVVLMDTANTQKLLVIKSMPLNYLRKKISKNSPQNLPGEDRNAKNLQVLTQTNKLPEISNTRKTVVREEFDLRKGEEKQLNTNVNGEKQIYDTSSNAIVEIQRDVMVRGETTEIPKAMPASYVSGDNENSSNYAFYNVTEEKFNKSKIGGFFRKVKRIIGRKISPLNNSKDQREMVDN